MRCLTPSECSEWLRGQGIIESPYMLKSVEAYSLQFEPPTKPSRLTAFTRSLFIEFGGFSGGLLVFTDWALYRPDEMAVMDALRRGHGERRVLIDAPGHLFEPSEEAEAIGFCYLALIFGWSAYLYLASGAATVQFWEGDLVDFWSSDEKLIQTILEMTQKYELKVTG